MPISDVFKNKAGTLVVAGKIEAGALKGGSKVLVIPGQATGSVRSIEVGGQVRQRGMSSILVCVKDLAPSDAPVWLTCTLVQE